jgi:4-deoxy-L-threo-5-hexosulose-uronate ketol-isomerase
METANRTKPNDHWWRSDSCQLQMGMTELRLGSVWNTMPAHVHDRRIEVYLIFQKNSGCMSLYGTTIAENKISDELYQAVISPPAHPFCSGIQQLSLSGEWLVKNLDYGDVDVCKNQ